MTAVDPAVSEHAQIQKVMNAFPMRLVKKDVSVKMATCGTDRSV